MADFKEYNRVQVAELREVTQHDLDNLDGGRISFEIGQSYNIVSLSQEDRIAGSPKLGDMIGRNPKNHHDQWLIAEAYFKVNFKIK